MSSLHSTMFLLILLQLLSLMFSRFSLHSTMFLLIRRFWIATTYLHRSLHSTMFLLILFKTNCFPIRTNFTFHDVSINTSSAQFPVNLFYPLHSTMFLLIPVVYSSLQYRYNLTTFCQSCHFIILYLFLSF